MPWKLDGTFQRINTDFNTGDNIWQQDQQAGIKIIAARHDTHDEDLALGIQESLNVNGLNKMLANLDMGGQKILNLAPATGTGELATYDQLIDAASFDAGLRELTLSRPSGDFPPVLIPAGDTSSVEGVWTPQITNATMGSRNYGWYVRDGRLVRLFVYIEWIQRVSSQNDVEITGLPFAVATPSGDTSELGFYATTFTSGQGMAVSGIGIGGWYVRDENNQVNRMWNPEAVVQGVVAQDANSLILASYFGTNNTEVNGYGDLVDPYVMATLSNQGTLGFEFEYLTDDPL